MVPSAPPVPSGLAVHMSCWQLGGNTPLDFTKPSNPPTTRAAAPLLTHSAHLYTLALNNVHNCCLALKHPERGSRKATPNYVCVLAPPTTSAHEPGWLHQRPSRGPGRCTCNNPIQSNPLLGLVGDQRSHTALPRDGYVTNSMCTLQRWLHPGAAAACHVIFKPHSAARQSRVYEIPCRVGGLGVPLVA